MSEADRAAFLRAIQADPADMTARLSWADYLEERDSPDGELIRLVCEVQASDCAGGPAWERLEALTGGLDTAMEWLGDREQRLLACDCAERILPLFNPDFPGNDKPHRAIETARRYAQGRASARELREASSLAWNAVTFATTAPVAAKVARSVLWAVRAAAEGVMGGAVEHAAEFARRAAVGRDSSRGVVERRWPLCRAVEYRLGFVPLPTFEE